MMWGIMMWGIWVSLVKFFFHVEVVIPWLEILLVCFSHVFIQSGMCSPCEGVVAVPFNSELKFPFAVCISNPLQVHILLHNIVLFLNVRGDFVALLYNCNRIGRWNCVSQDMILSDGCKKGNVKDIVNLMKKLVQWCTTH